MILFVAITEKIVSMNLRPVFDWGNKWGRGSFSSH